MAKGFGAKQVNAAPPRTEGNGKVLWWIVHAISPAGASKTRMQIPYKQSYNVEDIMVLTYERLKNMAALVLAAASLPQSRSWTSPSSQILGLCTPSTPDSASLRHSVFRLHALADGIKAILTDGRTRNTSRKPHQASSPLGLVFGNFQARTLTHGHGWASLRCAPVN